MTYNVFGGMLNLALSISPTCLFCSVVSELLECVVVRWYQLYYCM